MSSTTAEAIKQAGWDISIESVPAPVSGAQERISQAISQGDARVLADKEKAKRDKAQAAQRRLRAKNREQEIAPPGLADRIRDAIDEDWTLRAPLPSIEWEDAPGVLVGSDGTLLVMLRRKRESEWSVKMVLAGNEDRPDSLVLSFVGTIKSNCEAIEFAEGLRAGWYAAHAEGKQYGTRG